MNTLRVGEEVRVVQGCYFGKVGRLVGMVSAQETWGSYGLTHTVELQLWGPTIVVGGGIAEIREATPEAIATAQASGQPHEIDSGVHPWGFRECELKPLRDSQEPFWILYEEREQAHHSEVRRRTHRACNLWRCHKEAQAVKIALSSHPLNLLLSANDSPSNFKGPRLRLDKYVELCRAAGKPERQVTDIIFHMYFENRKVEEIGGLTPHCTCMEN